MAYRILHFDGDPELEIDYAPASVPELALEHECAPAAVAVDFAEPLAEPAETDTACRAVHEADR